MESMVKLWELGAPRYGLNALDCIFSLRTCIFERIEISRMCNHSASIVDVINSKNFDLTQL